MYMSYIYIAIKNMSNNMVTIHDVRATYDPVPNIPTLLELFLRH